MANLGKVEYILNVTPATDTAAEAAALEELRKEVRADTTEKVDVKA